MMWTGALATAAFLPATRPPRCEAVHEAVGVIDVSTLGKLLVEGPEAGEVPRAPLPEPIRQPADRPGPVRRAHAPTAGGSWTTAPSAARDEQFYVTTTSTGADGVLEWFEWWNAVWRWTSRSSTLTGALAAVNVAGPGARAARRAHRRRRLGDGVHVPRRRARPSPGCRALLLRIGFVGELGYEMHFPSPLRRAPLGRDARAGTVWAPRRSGSSRSGSSASRRRTSSSARTPTPSRTCSTPGMPWLVKLDKDDFVGKWALEHVAGARRARAAGRLRDGRASCLPEGGQVVAPGA